MRFPERCLDMGLMYEDENGSLNGGRGILASTVH